jgi:hypothetical protein
MATPKGILIASVYIARIVKDRQIPFPFNGPFNTDVFVVYSGTGGLALSGKAGLQPQTHVSSGGTKLGGSAVTVEYPSITFTGAIVVSGQASYTYYCGPPKLYSSDIAGNKYCTAKISGGENLLRTSGFTTSDSKFPTVKNYNSTTNSKGNLTLNLPTGIAVGDTAVAIFTSYLHLSSGVNISDYDGVSTYTAYTPLIIDNNASTYNYLQIAYFTITNTSNKVYFDVLGATTDSEIGAVVVLSPHSDYHTGYVYKDDSGSSSTFTISNQTTRGKAYGTELLVAVSRDNNVWGNLVGITTSLFQVANATGTDNSLIVAYRKCGLTDSTYPSTVTAVQTSLGPDAGILCDLFFAAKKYNSRLVEPCPPNVLLSGSAIVSNNIPVIHEYIGHSQIPCYGPSTVRIGGTSLVIPWSPVPYTRQTTAMRLIRQLKAPHILDRV